MKTGKLFRNISLGLLTLWLLLFVVTPAVIVAIVSFLKRDEESFVQFIFNLDNYRVLLDPLYFQVFVSSFSISLVTTFVCLALAYPFAFILTKLPKNWRTFALVLVVIPFWTNSLVRTYGIKVFIGTNGFLNSALLYLGLINEPLELLYTQFAVMLGTVYIYFPFMVLPLYSVIGKLDGRLIEAAKDLGAHPLQVFFRIIFPLTLPGIIAGSLLVFLPSLGCFYASGLLGGSKVLLLGNVVSSQFLEAGDWPFGSAVSVALCCLMSLMIIAYFISAQRTKSSSDVSSKEASL